MAFLAKRAIMPLTSPLSELVMNLLTTVVGLLDSELQAVMNVRATRNTSFVFMSFNRKNSPRKRFQTAGRLCKRLHRRLALAQAYCIARRSLLSFHASAYLFRTGSANLLMAAAQQH